MEIMWCMIMVLSLLLSVYTFPSMCPLAIRLTRCAWKAISAEEVILLWDLVFFVVVWFSKATLLIFRSFSA